MPALPPRCRAALPTDKSAEGYKRAAFEDVWKRYLQV